MACLPGFLLGPGERDRCRTLLGRRQPAADRGLHQVDAEDGRLPALGDDHQAQLVDRAVDPEGLGQVEHRELGLADPVDTHAAAAEELLALAAQLDVQVGLGVEGQLDHRSVELGGVEALLDDQVPLRVEAQPVPLASEGRTRLVHALDVLGGRPTVRQFALEDPQVSIRDDVPDRVPGVRAREVQADQAAGDTGGVAVPLLGVVSAAAGGQGPDEEGEEESAHGWRRGSPSIPLPGGRTGRRVGSSNPAPWREFRWTGLSAGPWGPA